MTSQASDLQNNIFTFLWEQFFCYKTSFFASLGSDLFALLLFASISRETINNTVASFFVISRLYFVLYSRKANPKILFFLADIGPLIQEGIKDSAIPTVTGLQLQLEILGNHFTKFNYESLL
jgi:hypothetical protein